MPLDLGLTAKVAVVTGGSAGIGRATARRLAREGARVAICARDPHRLAEAARALAEETGVPVLGVPADVRRPEDVDRLFATVRAQLGPVAILVNNAGTANANPFDGVDDATWQEDLDLKLFGAIRCIRCALPDMRAARWGRIVNLTAISGKTPGPSTLPTSVSRAAGIALTKALSKEVAGDGITVNTVCIGLVRSAQIDRATQAMYPHLSLEAAYAERAKSVPVGYIPTADEAADLIAFLVSARAGYLTGTAINFDGGASPAV
ncbi:MAG: SDR family oxidoreductase [Chloroflexota bacterium]|nr:SDR family oxidoreductase [Dehalococcoidia bacterium]MDW8254198.1 SDR family oxidoreductase [Chloroflexota bacterium]